MKNIDYVIAYLKNDDETLNKFTKKNFHKRARLYQISCYIENQLNHLVNQFENNDKFKKKLIKWTIKFIKIKSKIHNNPLDDKMLKLSEQYYDFAKMVNAPSWTTKLHNRYIELHFKTYFEQVWFVMESLR